MMHNTCCKDAKMIRLNDNALLMEIPVHTKIPRLIIAHMSLFYVESVSNKTKKNVPPF